MSLHEEANLTAPPPARRKLGLALLVIAAAQLMIVLDGTIVTVALPSIQNALRMAESDLNWVLTSYALAFGGLTVRPPTGWSDGLALTFDAVAAVLLIIFVLIQRRGTTPMLPPTVLADRGRLGANLVMFLMGGGMLATFYFLTLYMQVIKGYAPMLTGLAYLPFAIGIGIGAGAVGPPMLARTSDRTVTMTGLLLAAVGMAWFSLLTPDQNALTVLLPAQLAAGIGLGLVTVAVTIAGVRGVADQDTGIASGLINTTQQIGGALGLAVLAAIATAAAQIQPTGTPAPDALTQGYTTGILAGGALYLAAVLVAALTLKRRTDQAA
ncbi:MFS transporter [Nonomuraea africana]|uniref:MFS transporter n=1 Tax=Nonomuraea africana TaxID=46171 RepID=UPI0034060B7F